MSCTTVTINCVSGLSDPQTLILGSETANTVTAFSFATTTNIDARFYQDGVLIDSLDDATEPGLFNWAGGNGELICDFGLAALAAGTYNVLIVVINTAYPGGLAQNRGDGYTIDLVVTA